MIQYDLMDSFLISAKEDPRIGPNHISLFAGLVKTYKDQGGKSRVYVFRKDLASICKLNGTTTFHKTIRELHEYDDAISQPVQYSKVRPGNGPYLFQKG
eukprot:gene64360-88022_t